MTRILTVALILAPSWLAAQTVTCMPVNATPTLWPPAGAAITCSGTATPANAGIMRTTLETLGAAGNDASQRLQMTQINPGDQLTITIIDPSLNTGEIVLTHTTTGTDSLYTIALDFANQADAVIGFAARAAGNVVFITSLTGNATSYTESTSPAAVETITLSPNGGAQETATIGGNTALTITWYDFANHTDYYNSTPAGGGPIGGIEAEAAHTLGDSVTFPDHTSYSAIFESDQPEGTEVNQIVAHVTAHETGHQLDRLYAYLGDNAATLSASTGFSLAVQTDLAWIHIAPPCASFTYPYSVLFQTFYIPGVFTEFRDQNGNYICSNVVDAIPDSFITGYTTGPGAGTHLSDAYMGMTNEAIIVAAWPQVAGYLGLGGGPGLQPREIFAEVFAWDSGFPDTLDNMGNQIAGSDPVWGVQNVGGFILPCTQIGFVDAAFQTGSLSPNLVPADPLSVWMQASDGNGVPGFTGFYCNNTSMHFASAGPPPPFLRVAHDVHKSRLSEPNLFH